MTCSCPVDWSVCFYANCPRRLALERQLRAKHDETVAALGNPFKGVFGPARSPSPTPGDDQ